jgi:hypothetical protein
MSHHGRITCSWLSLNPYLRLLSRFSTKAKEKLALYVVPLGESLHFSLVSICPTVRTRICGPVSTATGDTVTHRYYDRNRELQECLSVRPSTHM